MKRGGTSSGTGPPSAPAGGSLPLCFLWGTDHGLPARQDSAADGKAGEMRIYLFHWEIAEVVEILKERMLGIKVVPYTPTFLVRDTHSDAIYPEVAEKILEFLERQTKDKVSTQETRNALEREGMKVTEKVWKLAIRHVGTLQVEWELHGKSFERSKAEKSY